MNHRFAMYLLSLSPSLSPSLSFPFSDSSISYHQADMYFLWRNPWRKDDPKVMNHKNFYSLLLTTLLIYDV